MEPPEKCVLVLTDSPRVYAEEMRDLGLSPCYAETVEGLLDHLLHHPASGFVLEVDKIMRAAEPARDQIFQLAGVFPVLRSLRKAGEARPVYMDDPGRFVVKVLSSTPREVRHWGRVPVLLSGMVASGDGPGFSDPVLAHVLDLSASGGFVSCPAGYPETERLRVSIKDLEDRSPILASIRWRKPGRPGGLRSGFGLRFLDIRPGQMRELLTRYLAPQPRQAPSRASA